MKNFLAFILASIFSLVAINTSASSIGAKIASQHSIVRNSPSVDFFKGDKCLSDSQIAWNNYWSASSVELDDKELERIWYHNMYFFNCSVRPGAICPGLFANWSYSNIGTAWHGDYHLNYNTQQPNPLQHHSWCHLHHLQIIPPSYNPHRTTL